MTGKSVQIVSTFPPYRGGTGTTAYEIARRWPQLLTITPDQGAQRTTELRERISYIKPLLRIGNGAVIPQVIFHIAPGDTVLLHYPFFGAAEYVLLARLMRRFKLIVYYHQDLVPPPDPMRAAIFRLYNGIMLPLMMRIADQVAVSSLEYARTGDLAAHYARTPQKFVEVPLAADTAVFAPLSGADAVCAAVDARTTRLRKPLFVFVGGLDRAHWFKGIDVLLEAWARVRAAGVDASLAIVGDGDQRASYEARSHELQLDGHVAFLGGLGRSELNCLFNRAYMTVLPSVNRSEAFGLVQLESLAAGAPVLVSDLPGVRTIAGGICGATVAAGDIQAWTDAIIDQVGHPDRRLSWALAARSRAVQYSWDKTVHILSSL